MVRKVNGNGNMALYHHRYSDLFGVFMSRLSLILLLIFGVQTSACATQEFSTTSVSLNNGLSIGGTYAGIRLLGVLQLPDMKVEGAKLCGLSGLAWDEQAGLLYAITDSGVLFHFRPQFDHNHYLTDLQFIATYPLRSKSGKPLRSPYADSEGLVLIPDKKHGETQLLVSFERRPRVVRYSTTGQWQGEQPLPKVLRNRSNYRDANKMLEAVAIDPRWGMLVGSEAPLRDQPDGQIRLYTHKGRFWLYPLGDAPGSALVAMESLPEGGLLTLERAYVAPLLPLIISLRRTELSASTAKKHLKVHDVAIFDNSQGWVIDNFEGLTRHQGQRFFMVSDNNCSGWQVTLLLYFELLAGPPQPSVSR